MKTIWKFTMADGIETFDMPVGARVVYVDLQAGQPNIWFECDPSADKETRRFRVFGTGHNIPSNALHRGTFQQPPLVWHVYEIPAA